MNGLHCAAHFKHEQKLKHDCTDISITKKRKKTKKTKTKRPYGANVEKYTWSKKLLADKMTQLQPSQVPNCSLKDENVLISCSVIPSCLL